MTAGALQARTPETAVGWPFRVLLVLTWIAIVPQLALGLTLVALSLSGGFAGGLASLPVARQILLLLAVTGATLGIVGIIRSRIRDYSRTVGSIEFTAYLLLIGLLTAAAIAAQITELVLRVWLRSGETDVLVPLLTTSLPLAILIGDMLVRLGRLDRRLLAQFARPGIVVPLTLLGMGLWLAVHVLMVIAS